MRKLIALVFFSAILTITCRAADLDIGTHASFFQPPEGGGNTLMTGVDAAYKLDDHFSAKASVDNASYQVGGGATGEAKQRHYSLTTISISLIYHILGVSVLDPYLGAGIGYTDKKVDEESKFMTSINSVAGIAVNFETFSAGAEIKYMIPDSREMETGFYSVGGQLTGGLHVSL